MEKEIIKCVIDKLYSVKKISEIELVSNWIDGLLTNKELEDNEYYIFRLLLDFKSSEVICDSRSNKEGKLNRQFVPILEDIIFDYFKKKVYTYGFLNVYDLPLNINLIEADILKREIKVYLQRPGLLIGKGGCDIDALEKLISEKVGVPDFKLLIVETKGRSRIRESF